MKILMNLFVDGLGFINGYNKNVFNFEEIPPFDVSVEFDRSLWMITNDIWEECNFLKIIEVMEEEHES